ncbi:MAG: glycosyltransferase family 9 protein, partial [Candidatus Margulisiibacteriota bacterium]
MKTKLLKLIDVLFGKIVCLSLGYLEHLFNWSSKDTLIQQPRNFLFIRPGGMGDFLYLLPTLKLLKKRFPKAQIHILAEKRNQNVRELTDAIDNILTYDSNPITTLLNLLKNRYEVVIDTEQFHNFSALFSYLTRAKVRIGFKTNPFRNHLYTHLIDYSLKGHEAGEFLRLLEPLGIKNEKILLEGSISQEKMQNTVLPNIFIDLKNKYDSIITVAPRGGDKYRYWSSKKYSEVIKHLLKDPKQAVVLTGTKNENKIIQEILGETPNAGGQLISLAGKTSLLQAGRLLMESKLFIGCDSGIAILAAMLGTKSATIFGSTDEKKWAIESPEHVVIRKKLPCAPCYMLGSHKFCRKIDCMQRIEPEDVISAVEKLFS